MRGGIPRSAASLMRDQQSTQIDPDRAASSGDHSMSSPLMSGFPATEADQVTLANWRTAPYMKWAFQHVREIVPSADIPNAPDNVWKLPSEPKDFSSFRLIHDAKSYSLEEFVGKTDTDGLVILHRGKV